MTRDGVMQTLMTMVAAYPNFHPADIQASARVWLSQLDGYSDMEVAAALKAYILSDTRGFAPSIGQVVALIPRNQDEGISELEAWGMVERAVRNGNYGAEAEFARLPDNVRSALGSAGQIREWASIGLDELATVAQSNFIRSYRAVVARERMAAKLPPQLQVFYHREPPQALAAADHGETMTDTGVQMPDAYRRKLGLPD